DFDHAMHARVDDIWNLVNRGLVPVVDEPAMQGLLVSYKFFNLNLELALFERVCHVKLACNEGVKEWSCCSVDLGAYAAQLSLNYTVEAVFLDLGRIIVVLPSPGGARDNLGLASRPCLCSAYPVMEVAVIELVIGHV